MNSQPGGSKDMFMGILKQKKAEIRGLVKKKVMANFPYGDQFLRISSNFFNIMKIYYF